MLKRRMWKVAIAHFALTAFFLWKVLHYGDLFWAPIPPLLQFWLNMFYLLQPLFLITSKMSFDFMENLFLVSIPVWSLCFGWIFVKLDNWLNHFPVLGKRVF